MFFFVVSMATILGRRLILMYNNLEKYAHKLEAMSQEKEKMLSELHDGLGGIMTNINLLAEITKKSIPGKTNDRALSTISSLSREGLSEIRSFMQSLDEKEMNWHSLVVQALR